MMPGFGRGFVRMREEERRRGGAIDRIAVASSNAPRKSREATFAFSLTARCRMHRRISGRASCSWSR